MLIYYYQFFKVFPLLPLEKLTYVIIKLLQLQHEKDGNTKLKHYFFGKKKQKKKFAFSAEWFGDFSPFC